MDVDASLEGLHEEDDNALAWIKVCIATEVCYHVCRFCIQFFVYNYVVVVCTESSHLLIKVKKDTWFVIYLSSVIHVPLNGVMA